MQTCIICQKAIQDNRELCDEHRSLLNSIFKSYNQDRAMRLRWDHVVELVKIKNNDAAEDEAVEKVFEFIHEIKVEFERMS